MRDYALGVTFDLKFSTRAFSTGIPTDFDVTSPVAAVAAYPDNSLTQITAGITLTNNFDGIAGLHNVRVVATGGNGYAAGSNYALVITVGEVDGVSVAGEVIGEFSLEAQSPLRPTIAARTLDVTATGAAGIDWGNIENPTTAQNLSATNIDVDQVVASVTGAVGSVTGNVGGNVTGSVGSVVGNVGGNVTGTIGGLTAAALADFFDIDSGETYASAVAGSVVKEIADNATVTGTPNVNVVQISGDAAAADALESILDGGGGTITANITGNLSGSVGSVTGAVGSVTGNVGGNVVGNVNGSVVGSVGSVVGNVGGDLVGDVQGNVQGDVQGNVDGSVAVATALGAAAVAQVNAEVLDVLNVDTFAEPTGVPPATTTLVQKIGRLHMALRNGVVVDSNTGKKQFMDDGGAAEWEKDFTDAAGVYQESEGNSP